MLSILAATPTPLVYFSQSNLVGKLIVVTLLVFSILAWTVMLWKFVELSNLRKLNRSQKRMFSKLDSLCGISLSQQTVTDSTLSQIFHSGLVAYHQEVRVFGPPCNDHSRSRCKRNIENAMSRTIAQTGIHYERWMTTLGSIVTASPFLGLLGTVWGVMDAFGSVAGGGNATLQHLAPGVSGALLTTVAALGVAIPSVVGYNYIVSFIKGMIVELENDSSEIAEQIEHEIDLSDPT